MQTDFDFGTCDTMLVGGMLGEYKQMWLCTRVTDDKERRRV
jgi:hypothetical protein